MDRLNGKIVERKEDKYVFYVMYTDVTEYVETNRDVEQTRTENEISFRRQMLKNLVCSCRINLSKK